jgi:MFS family permease
MALRLLIGAAEAFIHGTLIYLSFWYRYNELATRGAIFDGCAALAGAFNGIIGHQIQVNLDGKNGWRAWRWIFLIEGVVPIGWGFVVAAFLPSTPETVRGIFSPSEKDIIIRRSRSSHNTGDSKIRPKAMLEVLANPVFWALTLMNCCIHITTASLSNFLPPILDGLGWEDEQAQLMSSIVYACAFVNIMFSARVADRTGRRGLLVVANCTFSLVGFIMLLASTNHRVRFAGTCLLTAAVYPCLMLVLVWLAMNFPGYSYRTSCIAMINICAQLFSIIGNKVYIDPPYYREGLTVSASMTAVAGVAAAGLLWWLRRLNKRKEEEKDKESNHELALKSIDEVGNKHPHFRYTF